MRIGIVGGGAAGFFAAISAAEKNPQAKITILEKSNKVLSKVKISGGGRCNVTNATFENYQLVKNYPRGAKELKKAFDEFSVRNTIEWFEKRGVQLKTEDDKRIFPVTDNSQTIIDCFLGEIQRLKIDICYHFGVKTLIPPAPDYSHFKLVSLDGTTMEFDKVLVATGGHPQATAYKWLTDIGQPLIPPVPSLFTFNLPDNPFKDLPGIAVYAQIRIAREKDIQEGPVLITHWGLSGPGVLRLSAWQARRLNELNYNFTSLINWIPGNEEEPLRQQLIQFKSLYARKNIWSNPLFHLPRRLWERLAELSEISPELKWGDLPQKKLNKLLENLIRNPVEVRGKTTFRDEFVTCGGIDLKNIDFTRMESKIHKGLHFAGEILDIDGITGGFNFQAAWTTGYIAGKAIASDDLRVTNDE